MTGGDIKGCCEKDLFVEGRWDITDPAICKEWFFHTFKDPVIASQRGILLRDGSEAHLPWGMS